jgi:hypothetical protein
MAEARRDWAGKKFDWEEERDGIPEFFTLSEEERDRCMSEAIERVLGNTQTEPDRKLDPAERERFLRDFAGHLFLLGGVRADGLDFLYVAEPDGSRVKGLEKIVASLVDPVCNLAYSSRLVDGIVEDCKALGIVGERDLLLGIYLVGTSRLLDRPLSAIVSGPSSSGKSFVVEQVARLFPADQVLHAMRLSPQALSYYEEGLAHKFVVAGERSRVQGDEAADATAMLRQFQSEGRITKLVTEREEGKFKSRSIEQDGPIAYIETTTLAPNRIFPEDLNRALLLRTNDSRAQTQAILDRAASRYDARSNEADAKGIRDKHQEFQRSLRRCTVSVPFARALLGKLPTRKVEARRVANQVLSTIEAVALLHQHQRERDGTGRLVATLDDYEVARGVLLQPLNESLGVGASVARFYDRLAARAGDEPFSSSEAQKFDEASEGSVKNWLRQLRTHGCVELIEPAKGPKPATWRLTGKTPSDAVLPPRAVLEIDRMASGMEEAFNRSGRSGQAGKAVKNGI